MTNKNVGLYVHIPFCKRKCNYCDFCSFSADDDVRSRYVDAIIRDIKSYKDFGVGIDSIFFGGGTPSLLSPREFFKVRSAIEDTFKISPDTEFTIEANPATVDKEKLLAYRESGVNRISLGLQTIHENELKILGRIHSYNDFLSTLCLCRDTGFDNINIDLMYAFPRQTVDSLRETVDEVISLSPTHISLYGLILEEGTPLFRMKDSLVFPDEDTELSMYRLVTERLSSAGYSHYEISNYARRGCESRHNLKYWHDEEYIGVGLSAYSYFRGERYGKCADMIAYLDNPTENAYFEKITLDEEKKEYIMLALRLASGLSFSDYEMRFSEDFRVGRADRLLEYERLSLLRMTDKGVSLTEEGFYVSNTIISSLI